MPSPRLHGAFALLALGAAITAPAMAQSTRRADVDIPKGTLARALVALGQQTRVPVAIFDSRADDVRTPRVKGRLSAEEALERMLVDTGYTFRKTSSGGLLVVRMARRAGSTSPPPATAPRHNVHVVAPETPIVVTASKTGSLLDDYPANVATIDMDVDAGTTRSRQGTNLIIDQVPMLASTALGSGRNKLFARGIADTSFSGQGESNVGYYFGDLRLVYAGPDPDLDLFDTRKIEVLAGPYGTLYGTGALGGVVRIEPHKPDLAEASGRAVVDVASIHHGGTGVSGAAVANIPLVSDRAAVRVVGYRTIAPGYIDDLDRAKENINRRVTAGGRVSATVVPNDDSAIDIGFLFQDTRARDSQYTTIPGSLITRSAMAQPYSNDYLLSSIAYRSGWDGMSFVSTFGLGRQRSADLYPIFDDISTYQQRRSLLLSNETRASGDIGPVRAVIGLSLAYNRKHEAIDILKSDDNLATFTLDHDTLDLAMFGEGRLALTETIAITAGARINHVRDKTRFDDAALQGRQRASRNDTGFLPTVALSWNPGPSLQLFGSYRTGSRSGTIVRHPFGDYVSRPDHVSSLEAGLRYSPSPALRVFAAASRSAWRDIQADIPGNIGNTISLNIGDADIWGFDAKAMWKPSPAFSVESALSLNNGPSVVLNKEAVAKGFRLLLPENLRLPHIAKLNARLRAIYQSRFSGDTGMTLGATWRYHGSSGAELGKHQPAYAETGFDARFETRRCVFSLTVTNLLDSRKSRFALGNPIGVLRFAEEQFTPIQPRTVTLGIEMDF